MNKGSGDASDAHGRLALFDFAFQHAPIGIALVDIKGHILRGNAAFAAMIGLPLARAEGLHFKAFTHPDDLAADLNLFEEVLAGKRDGYTIEKRYLRPDGTHVHVHIHVAAMRDSKGAVVRFISQIEDITKSKEAERELAERAAMLSLAMQALRGGFWHMDVKSETFETSDRLAEFIDGAKASRLDLEAYLARINPDDLAAADLEPLLRGAVDQSVAEYRLKTIDGERYMRCDRRLLRDEDGAPMRIVGVTIDMTQERLKLEDLERRSETDLLSGLRNRRGFERGFEALQSASGYCILAIDLDGFKAVNDRYGHAMGDAILAATAERLLTVAGSNDLVARIGGDEFLIAHGGAQQSGVRLAGKIVAAMRQPIHIGTVASDVGVSIGGIWTQEKAPLAQLVAQADGLLYQVKGAGKGGSRFSANIRR